MGLEKHTDLLMQCNIRRLTQQCENEDIAKEILLYAKDKSEDDQNERRKFLNKRLKNRENLYIYREQANV